MLFFVPTHFYSKTPKWRVTNRLHPAAGHLKKVFFQTIWGGRQEMKLLYYIIITIITIIIIIIIMYHMYGFIPSWKQLAFNNQNGLIKSRVFRPQIFNLIHSVKNPRVERHQKNTNAAPKLLGEYIEANRSAFVPRQGTVWRHLWPEKVLYHSPGGKHWPRFVG